VAATLTTQKQLGTILHRMARRGDSAIQQHHLIGIGPKAMV
jgi:hypothetical protein